MDRYKTGIGGESLRLFGNTEGLWKEEEEVVVAEEEGEGKGRRKRGAGRGEEERAGEDRGTEEQNG